MNESRERLLATLPTSERRVQCGQISTPVIDGGDGPPLVLLHGPGGSATHWARVIPELVMTNRVIVPDLPGQGDSEVAGGPLDMDRVLQWVDDLIDATCPSPPVVVGYALGGAIAARFACDRELGGLVLVDTLGLRAFEPAPDFGVALHEFLAQPADGTHDRLWAQCTHDLGGVRRSMGERWDAFEAYNVERATTPSVQATLGALMGLFGMPEIPAEDLERIAAPTALVWGRYDLATPLAVAEAAGARYGWPLHVLEDCGGDPPIERPEAFVDALRSALGARREEARR